MSLWNGRVSCLRERAVTFYILLSCDNKHRSLRHPENMTPRTLTHKIDSHFFSKTLTAYDINFLFRLYIIVYQCKYMYLSTCIYRFLVKYNVNVECIHGFTYFSG